MLNEKQLISLREYLEEQLSNYKFNEKRKIDINSNILEKLIFKEGANENARYKVFDINDELIQKLDLSDISFDNFYAYNFDFGELYGVKINPQTVYDRDLRHSILEGVEIIGIFDGCKIRGIDFTGSTGAIINPQTIFENDLSFSNLDGVEITESLDDCIIDFANFTNCKNINLEEYEDCIQKIKKAFK